MIAAYLRERFRPGQFGLVAAVIAAAAATGELAPARFLQDAAFSLMLLLQFRVWDDIADREADRLAHPHRVLVAAASPAPLVRLCVALAAANVSIAWIRHEAAIALVVLAALHVSLGAWYALRSRRSTLGDQLLLAKYPAFVAIVGAGRAADAPLPLAFGAAAVYVAASFYEVWHDPASPLAARLGGRT